MSVLRKRRTFLSFAIVVVASGLGASCGVKGPLYLPEEPKTEEKKDKEKDKEKDKDNSSQVSPAPEHAVHS